MAINTAEWTVDRDIAGSPSLIPLSLGMSQAGWCRDAHESTEVWEKGARVKLSLLRPMCPSPWSIWPPILWMAPTWQRQAPGSLSWRSMCHSPRGKPKFPKPGKPCCPPSWSSGWALPGSTTRPLQLQSRGAPSPEPRKETAVSGVWELVPSCWFSKGQKWATGTPDLQDLKQSVAPERC